MKKRITRWLEQGIITKDIALELLKDVKQEKAKLHKLKLNITIYTISVILIGSGIISFIAGNDWILELLNKFEIAKIILLFTLTASSLWGGYMLAYEKKNFPKLGNALIVLSSLLIGATYALIGQVYNINANNAGLMFIWLISILPMAYLFKSFPINVISIVLYILGTCFYFGDTTKTIACLSLFMPLMLGCSLYSFGNISLVLEKFNNFSLSYKLTGLFPIFITLLTLTFAEDAMFQTTETSYYVAIVLILMLNFFNYIKNKNETSLLKIETIFINSILLFLVLMIALPKFNGLLFSLLAHIAIIAIISVGYNYGYKYKNIRIISSTNWYLIIYLLINYCRWSWDYLNKTAFFMIGGLLLLSLGIYLEKSQRKLK